MAKYRKKPVEIEAIRFDNVGDVYDFVGDHMTQPANGKVGIITLEGTMWASPGDYIIKGVKGEFYPCKADIFQETYDLVDGKEESLWHFTVTGAKLIQSTYPQGSLGYRAFQKLIDRYDAGERTKELFEALEAQE